MQKRLLGSRRGPPKLQIMLVGSPRNQTSPLQRTFYGTLRAGTLSVVLGPHGSKHAIDSNRARDALAVFQLLVRVVERGGDRAGVCLTCGGIA